MSHTATQARMLKASVEALHGRPERMVRESFEAFRIGDHGRLGLICRADTFEEALQNATLTSLHKDKLAIRRTDLETGDVLLSIYAVKQSSTPKYVPDGYGSRRVMPLYADHLHDIALPAERDSAVFAMATFGRVLP